MENYELTIGTIKHYRDKACKIAKCDCENCEATFEYGGKQYCQFETVIRFIEWDNQYNK